MQNTMQIEKVQKSYDLVRDTADKGIPLNIDKQKSFSVDELRERSFSIKKIDGNQKNDGSKKQNP